MRKKARVLITDSLRRGNVGFLAGLSRKYLLTSLSIVGGRPLGGPWLGIISPTYRCNLRCRMCAFWKRKNGGELDTKEIFRVIDGFVGMGTPMLSFTGGEPLLRHDLFELAAYAGRRATVHLATNGTLITPDVAKRICDAGVHGVTVSLDAAAPEEHDRIRGGQEAFQRTLAGIENLLRASRQGRPRVDVVSLVTENSARDLPRILELAERVGIETVGIIPEHRFGQDGRAAAGATGRHGEIGAALDRVILEGRRRGTLDNSVAYLEAVKGFLEGKTRASSCTAGWTTCVVDAAGDVYPCYAFYVTGTGAIGRVQDRDIQDVWFSDSYDRVRKGLFTCKKCLWNCHGEFDVTFRPAVKMREVLGY